MAALSSHDREEFGLAAEDLVENLSQGYDLVVKTVDHAVYKTINLEESMRVWELLHLI